LAAVLFLGSGGFGLALGNDGAASNAIGGIQLRREANVSMKTERLTISEDKVTVEYEFLNETDKDITTEVAFPIPLYSYAIFSAAPDPYFNDFRLWVEGKELKYNVDARAKYEGKDYTDLLRGMGMDFIQRLGYRSEGAHYRSHHKAYKRAGRSTRQPRPRWYWPDK
jgi:hypothetical protein